jgi:alpha-methylacyl-CoA racemase
LESVFSTRTRDQWAELLAPMDVCVAPVLTLEEAPAHPHNAARKSYLTVGGTTVGCPAPRFMASPCQVAELTEIGASTRAVLDELGYSSTDIDQLRNARAID